MKLRKATGTIDFGGALVLHHNDCAVDIDFESSVQIFDVSFWHTGKTFKGRVWCTWAAIKYIWTAAQAKGGGNG